LKSVKKDGHRFSQAAQQIRTLLLSQTISIVYKMYLKGIPYIRLRASVWYYFDDRSEISKNIFLIRIRDTIKATDNGRI